jgi:hypothetical protein
MVHECAARSAVKLFPRRKKQNSGESESLLKPRARGTSPLVFTRKTIEDLFSVSQNHAAEKLGVSATSLKKICRQLGISRWPYTKKRKAAAEHQLEDSDTSSARGASCSGTPRTWKEELHMAGGRALGDSEDYTDDEVPCNLVPTTGVLLKTAFDIHSPSPVPVLHERCAQHRDAGDEVPLNGAETLAEIKRSAVRAAQRIGDAAQVQVGPAGYFFDSGNGTDDFHDLCTSSNEDLHWLVPTPLQFHGADEPLVLS